MPATDERQGLMFSYVDMESRIPLDHRCVGSWSWSTGPDARLMRKGGDGARLVYSGDLVTENRNGLVVAAPATTASGRAEVEVARSQLGRPVGGDKGFDQEAFIS